MKKLISILLSAVLLLTCLSALAEPEYVGEINVGTAFMLTGTYAIHGTRAVQAIQMVVDNVNAEGGVQGYKINLIQQDAGGDTGIATNAINLLVESDIVAILGPHFSSQVFAVANIIEDAGIPTIVGGTNYKLPKENKKNLFLGRTNDLIQASAAVNYIVKNMNAKKVGIMYCSDDFGQGAFEVASNLFTQNGIEFVAEPHNTTDTDYYSTLLKMKDAGCDVVLTWSLTDALIVIARQINELDLKDSMKFFFSPGIVDGGTLKAVDHQWLDGFYAVQEFFAGTDDPDAKAFVEQYRSLYGETPDFLTGAYGGVGYVLVDALKRAKDPTDRQSVREAIEQTASLKTPITTYTCDASHRLSFEVSICQFDASIDDLVFIDRVFGTPE